MKQLSYWACRVVLQVSACVLILEEKVIHSLNAPAIIILYSRQRTEKGHFPFALVWENVYLDGSFLRNLLEKVGNLVLTVEWFFSDNGYTSRKKSIDLK